MSFLSASSLSDRVAFPFFAHLFKLDPVVKLVGLLVLELEVRDTLFVDDVFGLSRKSHLHLSWLGFHHHSVILVASDVARLRSSASELIKLIESLLSQLSGGVSLSINSAEIHFISHLVLRSLQSLVLE